MKTKRTLLLLAAILALLSACEQNAPTPRSGPSSSSASPGPAEATTGNGDIRFVHSPILPKADIFPLYPDAKPVSSYNDPLTEDSFDLDDIVNPAQFFAFYAQELPQYGWRLISEYPNWIQVYVWQSSDPTIQWDVVAIVQLRKHEFSAGPDIKSIALLKDPKLDHLPLYPHAQIEEKVDTGSGLPRTVRIVYRSDQSSEALTEYYRQTLPQLGWSAASDPGRFVNGVTVTDNKQVILTITELASQGTRVTLEATEKVKEP